LWLGCGFDVIAVLFTFGSKAEAFGVFFMNNFACDLLQGAGRVLQLKSGLIGSRKADGGRPLRFCSTSYIERSHFDEKIQLGEVGPVERRTCRWIVYTEYLLQ